MRVCEVKFKKEGKRYYFDPLNFDLSLDLPVVVQTIRGLKVGYIVSLPKEINHIQNLDLKPIIRIATEEDIKESEYNNELEDEVTAHTKELAKLNNLDMKILLSEYSLDRKDLVIFFEADGRVDFRELLKDLNNSYKAKIELRQVGPRDAAKMIGGIGPCGLLMCCSSFMGNFDNVSIKMAKNQNLSLNPQNISGSCNKLLCCIKYENDYYDEMRKILPDVNDMVKTEDGEGKVIGVQIIKKQVRVLFQDGIAGTYDIENISKI